MSRWWFIRKRACQGNICCLTATCVFFALKELGETDAECIIASDDECFTYNARVKRLNPIAEHKMIMKAVQAGVRPERIAATLNLAVIISLIIIGHVRRSIFSKQFRMNTHGEDGVPLPGGLSDVRQ